MSSKHPVPGNGPGRVRFSVEAPASIRKERYEMKNLLAIGILPLACLYVVSAHDTDPAQGSTIMLCTLEGVAKGYKGRDLEDFVATCVKSSQSGGEGDSTIMDAASAC
jgi:hypothetical protein